MQLTPKHLHLPKCHTFHIPAFLFQTQLTRGGKPSNSKPSREHCYVISPSRQTAPEQLLPQQRGTLECQHLGNRQPLSALVCSRHLIPGFPGNFRVTLRSKPRTRDAHNSKGVPVAEPRSASNAEGKARALDSAPDYELGRSMGCGGFVRRTVSLRHHVRGCSRASA